MEARLHRTWLNALLVAGFLLAIFAPAVMTVVAPTAAVVRDEFREPAAFPRLSAGVASFQAFPAGFDAWFSDSFWPRPRLIRWHNAAKLYALRVTPHRSIALGKEGWLFIGGEMYRACTRGSDPFSQEELDLWVEALERRDAWCRERGADFLFLCVPNKATVYPEYLPASFEPFVGPTRMDQLLSALRERTRVAALDLRPALAEAKKEHEIYYRHGTHWNGYGAETAYGEIMRWIGERRPGVRPLRRRELEWSVGTGGDSWAPKLYLADVLVQANPLAVHPLQDALRRAPFERVPAQPGRKNEVYIGPDADAPRLFVVHDSFAQALQELMPPHFSRSAWVWGKAFLPDVMQKVRPDVVIHEVGERILHGEPPDPGAEFPPPAAGAQLGAPSDGE